MLIWLGSCGWGFATRNGNGAIVLAGCKTRHELEGPEIEESRACFLGLQRANKVDLDNIIVKSDCLLLRWEINSRKLCDRFVG